MSLSRVLLSTTGFLWLLLLWFGNADAATKIVNPLHQVKTRREKKQSSIEAHARHTVSSRGALAQPGQVTVQTMNKLENNKRLNRNEKNEVARAELATYKNMRQRGVDEISNTPEAVMLRNYRLRNKKKQGFLRRKEASLAQILFPGVSPEEYMEGEQVWIYADLVESRKTQVPYEYYDLPGCPLPVETEGGKKRRMRKNLGARLQGHDLKPAPFQLFTLKDKPCTPLCLVRLDGKAH
jgi:hypothetical protein